MTIVAKDLKKIVAALKDQGFDISETTKGHVRVRNKEGRVIAFFGGTTSDRRGRRNSIAACRREGFVWPPDQHKKPDTEPTPVAQRKERTAPIRDALVRVQPGVPETAPAVHVANGFAAGPLDHEHDPQEISHEEEAAVPTTRKKMTKPSTWLLDEGLECEGPQEWHGQVSGYTNNSCRGWECTLASRWARQDLNRRRHLALRGELPAEEMGDLRPEDVEHGKLSTYSNWGCRCPECSAAYSGDYIRRLDREQIRKNWRESKRKSRAEARRKNSLGLT